MLFTEQYFHFMFVFCLFCYLELHYTTHDLSFPPLWDPALRLGEEVSNVESLVGSPQASGLE